MAATAPANPLAVLSAPGRVQDKPAALKAAVEAWVAAQPAWGQALAAAGSGAAQGAFLGALMGQLTSQSLDAPGASGAAGGAAAASMLRLGGPAQQARNFAVLTGVQAGVATYVRKARGLAADDLPTSLAAGFASGAAFSLVSNVGKAAVAAAPGMPLAPPANPLVGAISAGFGFALFQGVFFKLGEAFGGGKGAAADAEYGRVRAMLASLGLPQYEKALKKAQLTDATIMLWDGAALAEARVPPGPRLLILHHIDTYRSRRGGAADLLRAAVPVDAGAAERAAAAARK
jgi:hypothetical protein